MKDKLSYTYEEALKEEKELERKIRAELDSLGKPELMAVEKELRCGIHHQAYPSSI